jgi:TRAP-type mannitol/chloroaromatic compound transport system permease small subunit
MTESNNSLSRNLDRISIATRRATAWLTLLMVLIAVLIVILRYAFDIGAIWLQQSLTWMHAAVFMLGAAYTLQDDGHVRVDIFYRDMSDRNKAWVNLFGVLLFLFPLCGFFLFESFNYVFAAWKLGEVSRDAGGLPYPAIPLLKSILILMPLAVALQGLSMLLNSAYTLFRRS